MTPPLISRDTILAEIERAGGLLRLKRKLRRIDHELRPYVARQFVNKRVQLTDRYGRQHTGQAVAVARTTNGTSSWELIIDEGGSFWPVALSLATIDELTEVRA